MYLGLDALSNQKILNGIYYVIHSRDLGWIVLEVSNVLTDARLFRLVFGISAQYKLIAYMYLCN